MKVNEEEQRVYQSISRSLYRAAKTTMFDRGLSRSDQQFLSAALCDGEKAKQAWQRWRATLDFDQSGPRYMTMIPLLQQNLSRLGIEDPLMGKFKGIHRRIWYKNQLLLQQVSVLLTQWQVDGLEAICLTDIALATHYHADLGMRPIQTVNFLMRPNQIAAASHALQEQGWWSVGRLQQGGHQRFVNAEGIKIDLQGQLFSPELYAGRTERFWAGKVPIQIHNITAYALSPTDQLLLLCSQPHRSHFAHRLWIADALTILNAPHVEIDWQRFNHADLTKTLHVRLYLSLHELREKYDAPIPDDIIDRLTTSNPFTRRLPKTILRAFILCTEQRFIQYV